eukprot:CAMPEP_0171472934 /NCGR_PEP_ID=MMETSP0946-20130122/1557_1 /TAXON_ID=109269 /ORGANISM="Vaucheria litorea, Strain CCMP2940" /LENGTH=714 /DNA_ID=CAMNT_0012002633 /DNA_START=282 /DNA_END=2426 /DNA_ORIENTATION=-
MSALKAQNDTPLCHYRKFDDFYKLIERNTPIGVGAYGTVCAAAHRETGEVVAVKQIPRNSVTSKEVMSEVEILRVAGDHRHIIKLMDLFWDDDFWYVVMEMAHGGELFDWIVNKGLLSEHDTCRVMQDIIRAIEFLHMHNIVHGDIKPENIMIAEDTNTLDVRLGDFGTAFEVMGHKKKENNDDDDFYGPSRMTVAYSPPEVVNQNKNEQTEVGPKADVWALGVLMYILIAGRHPFDMNPGADEQEVIDHICNDEPDFSDPLWLGVSPKAIDLIKSLLDKDPDKRPSCSEALSSPWFDGTKQRVRTTQAEASEAFHHFVKGRRRIKACLLAVMVGIIDTSGEEYLEGENEDVLEGSGFYKGRRALTRLGFGPHAIGSRTVACKLIDRLGKGYIDGDDLTAVMRAMGEELSEKDINGMLKAIDGDPLTTNPSGQITFDQMSRLVPPLCPAWKFKPGEAVYLQGEDKDDIFYLIKRGKVQFSVKLPTGEQVLQGLSAGDSFGEVELVQNQNAILPRVCSCVCSPDSSERCELMAVTNHFFSLLTDVFGSVRNRIEAQTNLRLHQLAGEILRRGFFISPTLFQSGEKIWSLKGKNGTRSTASSCAIVVLSGTVKATWPDEAILPPQAPLSPEAGSNHISLVATQGKTEVLHAGDFCFCGDLGSMGGNPGEWGAREVIGHSIEGNSPAQVLIIPGDEIRKLVEKGNMAAIRSYLFGIG